MVLSFFKRDLNPSLLSWLYLPVHVFEKVV